MEWWHCTHDVWQLVGEYEKDCGGVNSKDVERKEAMVYFGTADGHGCNGIITNQVMHVWLCVCGAIVPRVDVVSIVYLTSHTYRERW